MWASACATCFTRLWENPPDEMTAAVKRFEQPASEVVAASGGVRPAEPGVGFAPAGAACGLSGVTLVTNDAHTGLVAAIEATVPGAAWQRCTTRCAVHLMSRNEGVNAGEIILGDNAFSVVLVEDRVSWGAHPQPRRLVGARHHVCHVRPKLNADGVSDRDGSTVSGQFRAAWLQRGGDDGGDSGAASGRGVGNEVPADG